MNDSFLIVNSMVPIVVVVGTSLVLSLAIVHLYKAKKRKFEVLEKAIERGHELPASFFNKPQKKGNAFRRGIILFMLGIAIFVAALYPNNTRANIHSACALIPLFLGIGYLIIHFIEKAEQEKQQNKEE